MTSAAVAFDERAELAAAARQLVDAEIDWTSMVAAVDDVDGFFDRHWQTVCEVGWPSIEIPERFGGSGGSFLDLCIVLQQLGRRPLRSPMLPTTVLGVGSLLLAGSEEQRRAHLPRLASGDEIASAALEGVFGLPGHGAARVIDEGGKLRLGGTARLVPHALDADIVAVAAADEGGATMVLLDAAMLVGRIKTEPAPIDLTRQLCTIELDGLEIGERELLGERRGGDPTLRALLRRGIAATSMEALGACEELLDVTVAYVKDRKQFGRPVGSFQAVKHHCADMFVLLETMRVAATCAAAQAARPSGEGDVGETDWSPIAKAFCGDAFLELTRLAIQCTGGMGFTWEYGLHLYLRRALLNQHLFGPASWHRAATMASLPGWRSAAEGMG
jgi:alkylation response protein AidB-like acyl-CoA dehydrogenase